MKRLENFKKIADSSLGKFDMSQESKVRTKEEVKTAKGKKFNRLGFIVIPALGAVIAFIVMFTRVFSGGQAKVYASDLMKDIIPQKVETVEQKEQFIKPAADFSLELFNQARSKGNNSLVSPTSVFLALGMTANGADSNTLKEFENLLGNQGINIKDLNAYYSSLTKKLTNVYSGKVSIANSIWFRQSESLNVKKDFLQNNSDFYKAAAYKADFDSRKTVEDINNWVKNNTNNLIDKIVDVIDTDAIMYLINTVYFEAQWEKPFAKNDVCQGVFKLKDGTQKTVDFMHSEEISYIRDDKAKGFIKPYNNGKYSFVALLPNEGVSIDSYVASLSGNYFISILKNSTKEVVYVDLLKFKSEYSIHLVEPLKQMGLKDCFDGGKANFSKIASSSSGNIYVSDVLHKTFITVDTQGTKAGAATKVEMKALGIIKNAHTITLNRPFLYAIIDNETNLPLFIGIMMNPES